MSVNEINKQWNETFQRAHDIEKALQSVRANIVNTFVQMDQKMLIDTFAPVQLMSDIQDFEYYQKSQLPSPISVVDHNNLDILKPTPKPRGLLKYRDSAFTLIKDYLDQQDGTIMLSAKRTRASNPEIPTQSLPTKNKFSELLMSAKLLSNDPIDSINGLSQVSAPNLSVPDTPEPSTKPLLRLNFMRGLKRDVQTNPSAFITHSQNSERTKGDSTQPSVERKVQPRPNSKLVQNDTQHASSAQKQSAIKEITISKHQQRIASSQQSSPTVFTLTSPAIPTRGRVQAQPISGRGNNSSVPRFQSAQRTQPEERELKKIEPIKEEALTNQYHQRMREMISKETNRLFSRGSIDMQKKPLEVVPLQRVNKLLPPTREVPQQFAKPRLSQPAIHRPLPAPEERFSKGRFLGKGKFGDVYEAYDRKTFQVVALKIIQKAIIVRHKLTELLTQEIKIQSFLDHPNILKLYGVTQDDKKVMLILELGHQDALKQLKSKGLHNNMLYQLTSAVDYLHQNYIIHRDLKIENVVMVNNQAKLADFGLAIYVKHINKVYEFCGTPGFIAPEVSLEQGYDMQADVYSLGVLIYETLYNRLPEIPLQPGSIEPDLFSLLQGLLEPNPKVRLTSSQALQHSWMLKLKNSDHKSKLLEPSVESILN